MHCGAAITYKDKFESLNEEALRVTACHLAAAMSTLVPPKSQEETAHVKDQAVGEAPGVRAPQVSHGDSAQASANLTKRGPFEDGAFIVVHGAGSFGHFQASQSGVAKGGLEKPGVIPGFVDTRLSVMKLNHAVVRALSSERLPAVGFSPFSGGWTTYNRKLVKYCVEQIKSAANAAFVPVLHGDAVLDSALGCTILSGDTIVRHLAADLRPSLVVFLGRARHIQQNLKGRDLKPGSLDFESMLNKIVIPQNVAGVYTLPPTEPGAVLIRKIDVSADATWKIVDPPCAGASEVTVQTEVAAHDTTGGMSAKIAEAAAIASLGVPVAIAKAGTEDALLALQGRIFGRHNAQWNGTLVQFSC
eukprot:jgi/Mesen1/7255/ME000373S06320